MYKILCDGKIFYHPLLKDYQITDGVCEMEVNKAGTLTLTVPEENLHYSLPKLRTSIITLYDDDDELLFRGVPYSPSRDLFLNSELTIVGELFFFNDSIQLPFKEYFGPVDQLFRKTVEYHNTQVDSWKQFKVGRVTVKNDTASGDIVRSSDHAMVTWEFIQEKFLKPLGGYLYIRHEIDGIYIDYLADLNYQGNQEVKQCINLIDAEEVVNSDELATVLVPYGARIKDDEGNETDERITIESVNSGKLGVENAKAIATYGRITKTVTYDDITEPLNLRKAAERDLALSIVSKTLEVKAADLGKAAQESDIKIESFRVGHKVPVKIDRMGINQRMLIKHLTLDLFAPESTVLQIGNTAKDFTSLFTNFEKPPKPQNGRPGKDGTDGKTSYLHIAYANSPDGSSGFSVSDSKNKVYIGQYTDFEQADSNDYKKYSWTKIKGENGKDGVSLTSIDVEYAQSSSYSTAPTTGWQTTAPKWVNGKYIWTRNKTVLSNGTTSYSKAVCVSGQAGEKGQSVTSITEEYYLSTSKTTQSGGSWVTSPPQWQQGKYIWTRSKVIYENPSKTEYTKPVCSSEWEAVNALKIGGRNLLFDSAKEITIDCKQIVPGKGYYGNKTGYAYYKTNPEWIKKGDIISVSFECKTSNGTDVINVYTQEERSLYAIQTIAAGLVPTTEWKRYTYRITAFTKDDPPSKNHIHGILFQNADNVLTSNTGTLSIRKVKYEFGDKATDWTPAFEDIQADIDKNIEQVRTDFDSNIEKTEQSIIQTVSKSHYSKEESDSLIESLSSQLIQSAGGFEMRFNQLKAELDKANGTIIEQNKYIKFIDGEIIIGIEECPLVAVHTNKALEFRYNGAVVGKFTNEGLYTRNVNVENRINIFGKWSIGPGQNGNLNIKWIGGGN